MNNTNDLLSVNETTEEIIINFNNFYDECILEEVIFTTYLSIKDNFSEKKVIFNVENEEIHKTILKSIE